MAYNLKDETEVKEYVEKLGVEYRFGCYSEKNPEVCHLLGDYLEGIKKDFEKAAKVFRSNCDDYGFPRSCLKYGNYLFVGRGIHGGKGSPVDAYKYYEKGCNLKDPDACLHTGLILVSRAMPKEIERDVPKGVEVLTKSCDMNNATACFFLSGMHISGVHNNTKQSTNDSTTAVDQTQTKKSDYKNSNSEPSKVLSSSKQITGGDTTTDTNSQSKSNNKEFILPKDMKKAFNYAFKACELKNMYACANLSQMYARGDGTEKSEEKAEKFKKLAIEMQDEVKKQQQQLEFQQGLNIS